MTRMRSDEDDIYLDGIVYLVKGTLLTSDDEKYVATAARVYQDGSFNNREGRIFVNSIIDAHVATMEAFKIYAGAEHDDVNLNCRSEICPTFILELVIVVMANRFEPWYRRIEFSEELQECIEEYRDGGDLVDVVMLLLD